MKRMILSALLAASLLCACETEPRESYRRTEPGYIMYLNSIGGYRTVSEQLTLMFRIDEYVGAATDEEREAVHDRYFYDYYVAYDEAKGEFTIRYNKYDKDNLYVNTGGKRIGETGAEWSGYYESRRNFVPAVKCVAENRYEVVYEEGAYRRDASIKYRASVAIEVVEAVNNHGMSLKINGECESCTDSDNTTFVVASRATDLLWQYGGFASGTLELTTENGGTVDTAEAEIRGAGDVWIEYGGYGDEYTYYGYYYPYY